MTSKENTKRILEHNSPERVGSYEHYWAETLPEWVKQGYPTIKDESGNEVPADPYKLFGMDMISAGEWVKVAPKLTEELIEETDEWKITRNGAGAIMRQWKEKSSTPEHINFEMNSKEIWEEVYKPYMLGLNPDRINLENIKSAVEYSKSLDKFTLYSNVFVFECLRSFIGDVCMCESMLLEPEWIEDINETLYNLYVTHYDYLFNKLGKPDAMWIYEDMGYNKGMLCSPNSMRKLIYPYHKKLLSWFKEKGLKTMLHSCGNITEGIPDFIDSGFVCLNPMEVKAGCDLVKFAKQYKDKLAFCGGMDIRIMETNDKDIIKKEMDRLFNEIKGMGAMWLFGSDHSIPPRVTYDTYRFVIDTYKENMYY